MLSGLDGVDRSTSSRALRGRQEASAAPRGSRVRERAPLNASRFWRAVASMRERILLMSDYLADPLWWESRPGMPPVDLDELPLAEGTRTELRRWADRYDRLMKQDYKWQSDQAKAAFEGEGRRLWHTLRSELGANWEVGYYSVTEQRHLWDGADSPS